MKFKGIATSIFALSLALSTAVAMAQTATASGEVKKVDVPAGKITIRHGPLKAFDMEDPMTMVYRAKDPAMLKTVKAGDKVTFDLGRENGQFTVTRIQKVK